MPMEHIRTYLYAFCVSALMHACIYVRVIPIVIISPELKIMACHNSFSNRMYITEQSPIQ